MMLDKIFPPAEELLGLEPEEVGELVLRFVGANRATKFNWYNFIMSSAAQEPVEVKQALIEGWIWLEREGLLIPDASDATRNFMQISRRGNQLLRDNKFQRIPPRSATSRTAS
jgi:hypothetical protein